jgi:hypothetical protein
MLFVICMNNPVYAEITEKKEKLTPGVYVRSQKIPPIKPNMIQKVGKVMEELGIRKLQKYLYSIKSSMLTNQCVCVRFSHSTYHANSASLCKV